MNFVNRCATAAAAASAVVAQIDSGCVEQLYYVVELGSAGSVTQRHGARTAAGWFRSPAALVQSGAWGGIAHRLRADRRACRPDHPDLPAQFGRPVEVARYRRRASSTRSPCSTPYAAAWPNIGSPTAASNWKLLRSSDKPEARRRPAHARHSPARCGSRDRLFRHLLLQPDLPEALSRLILPKSRPGLVRDRGRNEGSAAIALIIGNLARGLKLQAVAEGVKTEAKLAARRKIFCEDYPDFCSASLSERTRCRRCSCEPDSIRPHDRSGSLRCQAG